MKRESISTVMGEAISAGITTTEMVNSNSYYRNRIWIAIYNQLMSVLDTKYITLKNVTAYNGYEAEDYAIELTCRMFETKKSDKYASFVNAIVRTQSEAKKFNYFYYFKKMVECYSLGILGKHIMKKKIHSIDETGKAHNLSLPITTLDENGDIKKLYYTYTSTSVSVADDDSLTLEDTLISDTMSPEDEYIKDFLAQSESIRLEQLLKNIARHKNKLTVLSIIDILNKDSAVDMKDKIYYATHSTENLLVSLYNYEVDFALKELGINPDPCFFASDISEFTLGKYTKSDISSCYSRAKDTAKLDISKYYNITFERQIHRKKCK